MIAYVCIQDVAHYKLLLWLVKYYPLTRYNVARNHAHHLVQERAGLLSLSRSPCLKSCNACHAFGSRRPLGNRWDGKIVESKIFLVTRWLQSYKKPQVQNGSKHGFPSNQNGSLERQTSNPTWNLQFAFIFSLLFASKMAWHLDAKNWFLRLPTCIKEVRHWHAKRVQKCTPEPKMANVFLLFLSFLSLWMDYKPQTTPASHTE